MGKMTDAQIRAMKGSEKGREVFVDDNLYLRISLRRNGITKKKWILRFTDAAGGRQKATFGEYPEIGLAQAREMAADLLKRARRGGSLPIPGKRAAATFGELSEEWFGRQSKSWVAGHALRQRERLDSVKRAMGGKDFNLVTMEDIAASVSRKVDAGTLESARRTLSMIRKILEYADTLGRLEDNRILIRIDSYRKSLASPRRDGRHLYREMTEAEIGRLLADIEEYSRRQRPETATALRLAPLLMVRPMELCAARWSEIDLEGAEWLLPASRMKMGRDHIVPLPRQAVELLGGLRGITGGHEWLFPSYSRKRPHIGPEALIRAFRRMGYASSRQEGGTFFTTHGFRGMASTVLYQKLKYQGHLIELQLAHVDGNRIRAAYNRVTARSWLDERREMLQAYADWLGKLRDAEIERRIRGE